MNKYKQEKKVDKWKTARIFLNTLERQEGKYSWIFDFIGIT